MILTGKSIAELINISSVTDNSLFLVNQDNVTYSVTYSGMTTPMINTVVSAVTPTIANQAAGFAINPDIDSEIDITDLTYMSFSYDFSRESIPTSPVVSSSINQITVVGDYTSLISELPITLDRLYIEKSNYDYDINLYYYTSPVITSIGGNGSNTTFTFTPPLEAIYNQVQGIGSSNLGLYSHAEGVSTNANADYSHAEGGFTTSGAYGLYSTSISGGVITILNVPDNNQSDFFMLNKNEKDYIIFEDTRYENNYGFTTFEISGYSWVSSSLTLTINLVDTSVNTPAALIGTYIKTPYRLYNGIASHAEGFYTISNGASSHAEGVYTISLGEGSHAEGLGTSSFSLGSHSEGNSTKTLGDFSHAEGDNTQAIGFASHSEGNNTFSFGESSHAEGTDTFAINNYTHTEGTATFAGCDYTYITSINNSRFINVLNSNNFTEGDQVAYVHNAGSGGNNVTNDIIVGITGNTIEIKNNGGGLNGNIFWGLNGNTTLGVLFKLENNNDGRYAHSEGSFTAAIGLNSHSEGRKNAALGNHSHAEGAITQAAGVASHSEGDTTQANGSHSHAEGESTKAGINAIPAEVVDTTTLQLDSGFGDLTKSILFYDLSPGDLNYFYQNGTTVESGSLASLSENVYFDNNHTYITGTSLPSYLTGSTINIYNPKFSRVETEQIYPDSGLYNIFGQASHAEGYQTKTLGDYSHAEGESTEAIGYTSHAEGYNTISLGEGSHAEGDSTEAIGEFSHAEGRDNYSYSNYSHVEGYQSRAGLRGYNTSNVVNGVITLDNYSNNDLTDVFIVDDPIIFDDRDSNPIIYKIVETTISAVTYDGTNTIVTCNNTGFTSNNNAYIYLPDNPNPRLANYSLGNYSHAEGYQTRTLDKYSHAEGYQTFSFGEGSHSEGYNTKTYSDYSHAEGYDTETHGEYSHAEGYLTQTIGNDSHAEGFITLSLGEGSHAEGESTRAGFKGYFSSTISNGVITLDGPNYTNNDLTDVFIVGEPIVFDDRNEANIYGFAETTISAVTYDSPYTYITCDNISISGSAIIHLPNNNNPRLSDVSIGSYSHAEGSNTRTIGRYSHSEGLSATTIGRYSHAEGNNTTAYGDYSHSEGNNTQAIGEYSHAEGSTGMGGAIAAGYASHTEGIMNLAGAKGYRSTNVVNGIAVLDENYQQDLTDIFIADQPIIFDDRDYAYIYGGVQTTISASTFDGDYTTVVFNNSTFSGSCYIYLPNIITPRLATHSIGDGSHAEGIATQALGLGSHTEGSGTLALGYYSHAEGEGTIATKDFQHASGRFNKSANTDSLMVVGNGTYENRSDIFYINENSVNVEGRFDNGYRTYKALLTHINPITSGSPLTSTPSFGLIVGETYRIIDYVAGDDFLNVGASENVTGEEFVATGRYPTNWSNSSQLTVEIPTLVVNVLENTFDDEIAWVLNPFPFGEGSYAAYFSGGNQTFPREKTSIVTSQLTPYDFFPFVSLSLFSGIYSESKIDDIVYLLAGAYDGTNNYNYNGLLFNTSIEIKSYVGFKPTVYLNSYNVNGNGTVDFDVTLASSGSSTVTEFGIVWSLTPNPTIANYKQIFGNTIGTDTYTVDFDGTTLSNYTYARAYAINRAGVTYHEVNQVSFTPND